MGGKSNTIYIGSTEINFGLVSLQDEILFDVKHFT